jgi:uncharacterized protein
MALKIEKTFQVNEPIEKVWGFLSDPRKVVTCVPGAQITEQIDEGTYKGAISMKLGPSVTDYKGEVQIVRLDPQNHEIELLGKGQDVRGRGSASMKMTGKLRALGPRETELVSTSELNVVGVLAQLGSRVIAEVSNLMFDEFTRNLQKQLQQNAEPASGETNPAAKPKPIGAFQLTLSAVWAAIRRLFHRESVRTR